MRDKKQIGLQGKEAYTIERKKKKKVSQNVWNRSLRTKEKGTRGNESGVIVTKRKLKAITSKEGIDSYVPRTNGEGKND